MTDPTWDPADGPDPRSYDDLARWSDAEWEAWYDDHPWSVDNGPPLRAVVTIDPSPYL